MTSELESWYTEKWPLNWKVCSVESEWPLNWKVSSLGSEWSWNWKVSSLGSEWPLNWNVGSLGSEWPLNWNVGSLGSEWPLNWNVGSLGSEWPLNWNVSALEVATKFCWCGCTPWCCQNVLFVMSGCTLRDVRMYSPWCCQGVFLQTKLLPVLRPGYIAERIGDLTELSSNLHPHSPLLLVFVTNGLVVFFCVFHHFLMDPVFTVSVRFLFLSHRHQQNSQGSKWNLDTFSNFGGDFVWACLCVQLCAREQSHLNLDCICKEHFHFYTYWRKEFLHWLNEFLQQVWGTWCEWSSAGWLCQAACWQFTSSLPSCVCPADHRLAWTGFWQLF